MLQHNRTRSIASIGDENTVDIDTESQGRHNPF